MRVARAAILLDTKPLLELTLHELGIASGGGSGWRLRHAIRELGVRCVSLWPVFTEALYFIYRDLGKRKDFSEILERVKRYLRSIGEVYVPFDDVLNNLKPQFDIADTALLKALRRNPLLTLVSEDMKLVNKARKMGLRAITVYELTYLT